MAAALTRVEFRVVEPYRARAARDHVAITPTGRTLWFVWGQGHAIYGVGGLIRTSTGFRIKGIWVLPSERGKGFGSAMTDALIRFASDEILAGRIEALAHNPSFYEKRGFKRTGRVLANGAVEVARNF